jgi:hypothetical protein
MGDIMVQIGRNEWKLNMVGTSQSNQTGANVKDVVEKMKPGTYKPCFWQHNTKNLVYGLTTLSSRRCQIITVQMFWSRAD